MILCIMVVAHDLLSASWRPRKAVGVIQSESEDLRTRETNRDITRAEVLASLRTEIKRGGETVLRMEKFIKEKA